LFPTLASSVWANPAPRESFSPLPVNHFQCGKEQLFSERLHYQTATHAFQVRIISKPQPPRFRPFLQLQHRGLNRFAIAPRHFHVGVVEIPAELDFNIGQEKVRLLKRQRHFRDFSARTRRSMSSSSSERSGRWGAAHRLAHDFTGVAEISRAHFALHKRFELLGQCHGHKRIIARPLFRSMFLPLACVGCKRATP
jgi:hypothetical protein